MNIEFCQRSIDRQIAAYLCRDTPDESGVVRTAVSLLSQAVGQGHVCLDQIGRAHV